MDDFDSFHERFMGSFPDFDIYDDYPIQNDVVSSYYSENQVTFDYDFDEFHQHFEDSDLMGRHEIVSNSLNDSTFYEIHEDFDEGHIHPFELELGFDDDQEHDNIDDLNINGDVSDEIRVSNDSSSRVNDEIRVSIESASRVSRLTPIRVESGLDCDDNVRFNEGEDFVLGNLNDEDDEFIANNRFMGPFPDNLNDEDDEFIVNNRFMGPFPDNLNVEDDEFIVNNRFMGPFLDNLNDDDDDDFIANSPLDSSYLELDDGGVEENRDFEWEDTDDGINETELSNFERLVSGLSLSGLEEEGEEVLLDVPSLIRNMEFIDGENANASLGLGVGLARPPASKAVVEKLPSVVITKEDLADEKALCAVCKDMIEVGEEGKELPCLHRYHGDCIVPWLGIQNTCPVCRFELPTDDPEYEQRRTSGEASGA